METDFPAAHSMDTGWFAVDEAGRVAIFDSGENGHVPEISSGDAWNLIDELWRHRYPEGGESPYEGEELANELGMFFYD